MLDRTLPAAPRAERRPVISTRHGITLTDDYAWLRADNWRELMRDPSVLDASIRVDPGWTDWRYYQAGLAAFGEGRFEDAALVLQKIDPRSREPWPKFYGLQVLLSAYGHLGRSAEIAATN